MKLRHPVTKLVSATLILTLAACGGGGNGDTAAAEGDASTNSPASGGSPTPVLATLTGHVHVDQAIRNAVVCLDLNTNSACDADEPASARTGADGAYSVSYDTAKVTPQQVAAASLIAPMVPGAATDAGTTLDAANPATGNTTKAYVLKQVPGKAGQINPLTTLVAAGMATGMTETVARGNTVNQLGIAEARIDNYQDDPASDSAKVQKNARTLAVLTAQALQAGVPLAVGNQLGAGAAAPGDLASLRYFDAANYFYRTFDVQAKAEGTPDRQLTDARAGKTAGVDTTDAALYAAAYLSSAGWVRCGATTPFPSTRGTPSRSTFCNASESAGYTTETDIAGQTMGSVVSILQADTAANTINNGVPTANLLSALGGAVFPSGSTLRTRNSIVLTRPLFINNLATDARPASETTLEETIAARQASGVSPPALGTSLSLGLGSGNFKNLRVAFTGVSSPAAGTVQFYECDLDSTQTIASNCAATQTGTYAIGTESGVRVMRFAGHAPTVMNHTRAYVEVKDAPALASGNRVFVAREPNPSLAENQTVSKRLNATAWAAMKTQLGL